MGNNTDHIYKIPVNIEYDNDTVYVDMQAQTIKKYYTEIFGDTAQEMFTAKDTIKNHVLLFSIYVSLFIFITVTVSIVNVMWNKTYIKLKQTWKNIEPTQKRIIAMSKLSMQKYSIWDRLFIYWFLWFSALSMDAILITSGIVSFPYLAIPLLAMVIKNVIKRLANTYKLKGYNDTDLINNFDVVIKHMIVDPIIKSVTNRISSVLKKGEEE